MRLMDSTCVAELLGMIESNAWLTRTDAKW